MDALDKGTEKPSWQVPGVRLADINDRILAANADGTALEASCQSLAGPVGGSLDAETEVQVSHGS